MHHTQKWAVFA